MQKLGRNLAMRSGGGATNPATGPDSLTGVHRSPTMISNLKRKCEKAAWPKIRAYVAFVDIVYFQLVNDTYGHAMANKIV
jgi:diguanylate cyclase (GGDEF)-like protein